MTTNAKEILIISDRVYSYKSGDEHRNITKRESEKIFKRWKDNGETVHRKYGMNGRTCWVWIE
jgi:hypothetical protein